MTVRGGGHPADVRWLQCRREEWARHFGVSHRCARLHHGSGPWTYRIQGCGAIEPRPESGLSSDRHRDRIERAVVLEAVKVWPGKAKHAARLVRRPILTASARIDLSDARAGMKKRTLRSNQETDEGKRCAALANSLTKKAPYKGLGADSEEKHEPVSDIDTAMVDSLKVLDPKRPIREGDICTAANRSVIR